MDDHNNIIYQTGDWRTQINACLDNYTFGLSNNGVLNCKDCSKRIAVNTLVALTLMIAESRTKENDVMMKAVVNSINQQNE